MCVSKCETSENRGVSGQTVHSSGICWSFCAFMKASIVFEGISNVIARAFGKLRSRDNLADDEHRHLQNEKSRDSKARR